MGSVSDAVEEAPHGAETCMGSPENRMKRLFLGVLSVIAVGLAIVAISISMSVIFFAKVSHGGLSHMPGQLAMAQAHSIVKHGTFIDHENHLQFQLPDQSYVIGVPSNGHMLGTSRHVNLRWGKGAVVYSRYPCQVSYTWIVEEPKEALEQAINSMVQHEITSRHLKKVQILSREPIHQTANGFQARLVYAEQPVNEHEERTTEIRYLAQEGFFIEIAYVTASSAVRLTDRKALDTMFEKLFTSFSFR